MAFLSSLSSLDVSNELTLDVYYIEQIGQELLPSHDV
jgi:hypothetical protein